jgi:hypothetical protein
MEILLQSSNQSIRMMMTGTVYCEFPCNGTSLTITGTGAEYVTLFIVHVFCDHLITPESLCVLCILRTWIVCFIIVETLLRSVLPLFHGIYHTQTKHLTCTGISKSSWPDSVMDYTLNFIVGCCCPFKIFSFWVYAADPVFLPLPEAQLELMFGNHV